MYNSVQPTCSSQTSPAILPNVILIIASIYLIFVISETVETRAEKESGLRKILYYTFLFLDLCALIYINGDNIMFNKIQSYFKDFIKKMLYKNDKKSEPEDEIKNLVE